MEHKRYVKSGGTSIDRLKTFRNRVRWGPSFPCITCHQTLFQHQVFEFDTKLHDLLTKKCSEKRLRCALSPAEKFYIALTEDRAFDYDHRMRYKKSNPGIPVPDQITFTTGRKSAVCNNIHKGQGSLFICKVCTTYLKKDKLPPKAVVNCLTVVPVPEDVLLRSYLEEALIARVLLFIKIFSLKSSLMPAIKDKYVVIPLDGKDIQDTIESLP